VTGCARGYLNAFTKRQALLADCGRKLDAFDGLSAVLAKAQRALVFTQTKHSAESAAGKLQAAGVLAQAFTSDLKQDERRRLLEQFHSGRVPVLCAPRVLDEGVDVPEADVGVIVASSRSRRQMIQRMGRIIRPNLDGHPACFFILYVRGTSEDPELGAHEVFLQEVIDVADDVRVFRAGAKGPELLAWYTAGRAQ
jgi:superfamily II DNA or RNA helicase